MYTLDLVRRRGGVVITPGAAPFSVAFAANAVSNGPPAFNPIPLPVPIGPVNAKINNALLLNFIKGQNNPGSYVSADVPAGYTLIQSSIADFPDVFQDSAVPGANSVNDNYGGGLGAVACCWGMLCVFNAAASALIQQLTGGATIFSGTNTRTLGAPTTAGSTLIFAANIVSDTGFCLVNNVHDSAGNIFSLLGSVQIFIQAANRFGQIYVFYKHNILAAAADTISFDVSGGNPDSGTPWIAEYHL